jgi:YVTN family beta-propeller protein
MSRINRLRPLAGLLAAGLASPAVAGPSVQFPTYTTGLQPNGSYVVSDGQIITPAGTQVSLGIRVRAKAVAVNPNLSTHTAAVLTMGASAPVQVFDTLTGQVVQSYLPFGNAYNSYGTYGGISYSSDGKYALFGEDFGQPYVTTRTVYSHLDIASVGPDGRLSDFAQLQVPPDTSLIKCFPNSPIGPYGEACGQLYTGSTSYPGGTAFAKDGKSAYALLNQNNTLVKIDLTQSPPSLSAPLRVGNAPSSVLVNGHYAYVSNEGGRAAVSSDFTVLSAGTPIVADPIVGAAVTGTVSVVDTATMKVRATIPVGLHPTGMAVYGSELLVTNTYSDTISVIDIATNQVVRTINLGLPIRAPGATKPAYGAAPNAIAVDQKGGIAYVALYNANAVAVVDIAAGAKKTVLGLIPVAYAPASVAYDAIRKLILVANDKGIGTLGSFETDHGVTGYNTHQDTGTASIIPVPATAKELETDTIHVEENNHWDLKANIASAGGGSYLTPPVAIPAHIGDPSLIKHVFLIIRENRTYDQILGDVAAGNGDPSLAVFGGQDTPNMHALVQRFPLLDNFYAPSRQSADGHQWISEAMAPYADDIESPDWVRSYPGGEAGDALAYQKSGFIWSETVAAGLSTKIYGEYVENATWTPSEPSWSQFFADSQAFEAGQEKTLQYQNDLVTESSVPAVENHLIKGFPQFDLGVPDQWRVDWWVQDFNNDLANGTVPSLSVLWIMCDHTGGPPTVHAEEADNDLAVGRIIDYISHSSVWPSSAIFIEEDDAQNGVDHIDGHRTEAYVVSPYAVQGGPTDHTYYTASSMTRTIEQILGVPTMDQFDLVASPMYTDFTNTPNFAPWSHVPNQVPLNQGVTAAKAPVNELEKAWRKKKAQMFAGKLNKPDSEDETTLNHLVWYEATGFARPYPGETKVRPPSDFADRTTHAGADSDD